MEQEPIKIVIEEDETAPFVPEDTGRNVKARVGEAGKQAATVAGSAAKKAWRSNARKKVTRGMKRGATAVAAKGGQAVQTAVVQRAEDQARQRVERAKTRIRETDWKAEAKTGAERGLRWLSQKLARLAERVHQNQIVEKTPEDLT